MKAAAGETAAASGGWASVAAAAAPAAAPSPSPALSRVESQCRLCAEAIVESLGARCRRTEEQEDAQRVHRCLAQAEELVGRASDACLRCLDWNET